MNRQGDAEEQLLVYIYINNTKSIYSHLVIWVWETIMEYSTFPPSRNVKTPFPIVSKDICHQCALNSNNLIIKFLNIPSIWTKPTSFVSHLKMIIEKVCISSSCSKPSSYHSITFLKVGLKPVVLIVWVTYITTWADLRKQYLCALPLYSTFVPIRKSCLLHIQLRIPV